MAQKQNKPLFCGLLAALCLLGGLRAGASGGEGDRPASLSYLNDHFRPALEEGISARAAEDIKGVGDAALARINALGQQYAGGWTLSQTPQTAVFSGGDALTLAEGGSLLWLAGTGTAGGGLVDATAGAEVPAGGKLSPGHRYLNGLEGTGVLISVASDKAQAAPAGRWSLAPGSQTTTPFYDLCRIDWFYDGVCWAIDQGLFRGMSPTQFDPGGTVNRAMLTTLLHRLMGSPELPYQGKFSDVPAGQWYTQGIEWAAANGVAQGIGDGTFSPTRAASREEIVLMLYRCAGLLGLNTSASAPLTGFYDSASVTPAAQGAVSWAVATGILKGSDGWLLPQDNTTRAQVALILQRFQSWRGAA